MHVDGEVATDATLVALFRTDAPFAALRVALVRARPASGCRITKLDESHQRALEIDGQARRAALRRDPRRADRRARVRQAATASPVGPTALKVGKEYFMRAPWKPLARRLHPVREPPRGGRRARGDEARRHRRDDPEVLHRRPCRERVPSPTAALLFHCGARSWFARAIGEHAALASTFASAPPCVGFDVHFEIYCGFHINTTLTSLVFGAT